MISHRQIMINAAQAVQASQAVADYCYHHFGRALQIIVGAYAQGIPAEADAPFLWMIPDEGENQSVNTDEQFSVYMVVAGCVKGPDGEQKIETVGVERTATTNGLQINGGNKIVEDLRDMILGIVRNAKAGARVIALRRRENDISHFPLEWAEFGVDYEEPESLTQFGG